MKTIPIKVSDELQAKLREISREKKKPITDVVRESLRRFVAIERFRSLRKKALPFAKAQGFVTDEDVFKVIS